MASSDVRTPATNKAEPNLWGVLDSLIDRLVQEGATRAMHRPSKQNHRYGDALSQTYRLSRHPNHSTEVSDHHRKVTEKMQRSRRLFESVSPYVKRHKHISQLLDIMPHDNEEIAKKRSRQMKKVRAKPFRDISDWGLTDSDTGEDSGDDTGKLGGEEKPMVVGADVGQEYCTHETIQTYDRENPMVIGNEIQHSSNTNFTAANTRAQVVTGTSCDGNIPPSIQSNVRDLDNQNTDLNATGIANQAIYDTNNSSDKVADGCGDALKTNELKERMDIFEHESGTCNNTNQDNITENLQTHFTSHCVEEIPTNDFMKGLQIDNDQARATEINPDIQSCSHNPSIGQLQQTDRKTSSYSFISERNELTDFINACTLNVDYKESDYNSERTSQSLHDNVDDSKSTLNAQVDQNVHCQQQEEDKYGRSLGKRSDAASNEAPRHWDSASTHSAGPELHSEYHEVNKSAVKEGETSEKTKLHAGDEGKKNEDRFRRQPMNKDLIVEIGDIEQDEMDHILEALLLAQRNFKNVIPSINQEEFQQKMDKYVERKRAELGDIDVVVTEADAKRVTLLEHVIKYFEKKIIEIVKFAKCIPGFKDLGLDDQANLIKASRTESGLVGGVGVSLQEGVVKAEDDSAIPLDLLATVVSPQYLKEVYRVTSKLDSVNITDKEGALLRGITITYTDRCKLNEPEKVQSIQNKMVTCLLRVVEEESTETSAQVRMGQLVEVLTTLRNYTDADSNLLQNALNNYPNYSSNDLVREFLEPHA